jgi:SAM-dependent methyltransferase
MAITRLFTIDAAYAATSGASDALDRTVRITSSRCAWISYDLVSGVGIMPGVWLCNMANVNGTAAAVRRLSEDWDAASVRPPKPALTASLESRRVRETQYGVRRVVSNRPVRPSRFSRLHDYEYDSIVKHVEAENPGCLLDWGCGYGHIAAKLQAAGVSVTAFEYLASLEPQDELGLERFYPGLEVWVTDDPVRLPFGDASFDSVLSLGVLEHVQRPDESLEEIRRVLRPGGTFYVFKLPNRYSYVEKLAKWTGGQYHGGGRWPGETYSRRWADERLSRHGFRVDSFRRANMLPLNRASFRGLEGAAWRVNRALSSIPVLNLLSTDLELKATRLAD